MACAKLFFSPSLKGKEMKFNVGGLDRILRIAIGLVLIALAATGTVGWWGWWGWWGWLGVLPLLTGIFRFCPAYPLLGISSCKR
jgi:hypothetical protein